MPQQGGIRTALFAQLSIIQVHGVNEKSIDSRGRSSRFVGWLIKVTFRFKEHPIGGDGGKGLM